MFTKQLITALATFALAQDATARSVHRHQDKRGVHVHTRTHVVTEWVTVTAVAGQQAPPKTTLETFAAPAPTPEAEQAQPEPQPQAEAPAAPAPVETPEKQAETDSSSSGGSDSSSSKPSGGKPSGGKRGLAFNKAELCDPFVGSDKISWAWNWDQQENGLDSSIEFVPALWGPIDIHTSRWEASAEKALSAGTTHLMSFNECDIASQCNLSPSAAADGHVKYMNPYADRAQIGAPSVSNSNIGGQGLDWLQEWVDVCESKGCKYDFCNVHWYSPLNAADTLYDHIKQASKICGGKPIWLTEFAPLGSDGAEASASEASGWLGDVLSKLDALDELERYSYFMVADGKLTSGSGLSPAGEAYLS